VLDAVLARSRRCPTSVRGPPAHPSRPVMVQAEQTLGTGQYIRTTFIFVVITPLIQQLLHHMLAHTRWGEQSTRVVRPHSRRRCGPTLRSPATDLAQPRPHVGRSACRVGWRWVLGDRVWMDDAAGAHGARRSNGRPFVRTARYARTIRTQPRTCFLSRELCVSFRRACGHNMISANTASAQWHGRHSCQPRFALLCARLGTGLSRWRYRRSALS
jgi:hypothetical protein